MATRQKTIQFAFDTYTGDVTDATVTNLTQTTLYIPETVISFVDVSADMGWNDFTTSSGTISEIRCGLQLGAAGYSTITDTDNITSSGENMAGLFSPFDFTSYFTTNWTGTSMTCDLQVYFDQSSGASLGMRNVTSIITITYEYNDDSGTNATQIKTAWIPLESITAAQATTQTEIGTNQIPILTGASGLLCEASPTIRDFAFIIGDADSSADTGLVDWTINLSMDSGATFSFGVMEQALQSNRYFRGIWRPTPLTTTATHTFDMWVDAGSRGHHMPILLMVTYEFDASSTTKVLNSLRMPITSDQASGTISGGDPNSRNVLDFYIQEPTTITLKQSGVKVGWRYTANVSGGVDFLAGSQVARNYTMNSSSNSSIFAFIQRIDSGGAQGAGITLARGKNTIVCDLYSTTLGQVSGVNTELFLNYHSGLDAAGIGAHNHTVIKTVKQWDSLSRNTSNNDTAFAFDIPETSYYLNSIGYYVHKISLGGYASTLDVQVLSGEWKEDGYFNVHTIAAYTDAERGYIYEFMNANDVFFRFPGDVGVNRVDAETARYIKYGSFTAASWGIQAFATYHSITYTAADSITGFSGTVTLGLHDATTGEKLQETSRSGDGAYSFTWYDDTDDVFIEANDGTNVGRSLNGTAS